MSRCSAAEVRVVIDTALEDDEITPLITQASAIVTSVTATASPALSEELLKTIETWLTAHLIAVGKERMPIVEKVGDIWLQFDRRTGLKGFLELTPYGEMVLFLDPTGAFQQQSLKRASIRAIKQDNCD